MQQSCQRQTEKPELRNHFPYDSRCDKVASSRLCAEATSRTKPPARTIPAKGCGGAEQIYILLHSTRNSRKGFARTQIAFACHDDHDDDDVDDDALLVVLPHDDDNVTDDDVEGDDVAGPDAECAKLVAVL